MQNFNDEIITNNMINDVVKNKPARFDMAINFYCCVKKDGKYYLVAYYNAAWNLFYPFYDDVNKTPILEQSSAETYRDLIKETNAKLNINLEEKLNLAHKRFRELIGCDCKIKKSKTNEVFELKYSKTANLFTIYKLYNYIITEVENINITLNPNKLKCKLFELDKLDNNELVNNAIWFCEQEKDELENNVIILK